MIEESYVSFDTACMLKDAGFDEICCFGYDRSREKRYPLSLRNSTIEEMYNSLSFFNEWYVSCPTQALAVRWLREIHRIVVDVTFNPPLFDGVNWLYFIGNMDDMVWEGDFEPSERKYATYEAALEAGIQEAIKLIKK